MSEEMLQIYKDVANGDPEALDFLLRFGAYAHGIDDLVDGVSSPHEQTIALFALALGLYSSPFWIKYHRELAPIMALITNDYADSVAWAHSPEDHKRNIAEIMRFCGNKMSVTVAYLTGGYAHMRKFSPIFWERTKIDHIDQGH